MRTFDEYKRNHNDVKMRSGEKIFYKQLQGIEGRDIIVDGVECKGLVHNNINPMTENKEYRGLHTPKNVEIKHGSYVIHESEHYMVVTDIDNHYVYNSCKIRKCNQTLKWKKDGIIHEYPCIVSNDSYGVKVLSDNEYVRTPNIKAQILIPNNEVTRTLVPDMRFIFNHSKFDIYKIVDISTVITNGTIILTTEKVVYEIEDDLENNLAFIKEDINKENSENTNKPTVPISYEIQGVEGFKQKEKATFTINPNTDCYFYIDDFDTKNIASIESDSNGSCVVLGKAIKSNTWFTLYAKNKNDEIIAEKVINLNK